MKKIKLFLDNFLVYGIGSVISKIIPLILLPVITRLLPNSEYYGLYDLSNTILQFSMAFCVLGMYDTIFRMYFEEDDEKYRKDVCSTAFFITICSTAIVVIILVFGRGLIAQYVFKDPQYISLVFITIISIMFGATNTIVATPTRLQNKRIIYIVTNTISPLIAYGISIVLLLKGYYVLALPIGSLISAVSLEIIFVCLNKSWFSLKNINKKLISPMLRLGVPLTPSILIYWVFNSSDRLMISYFLSVSAVGIYSVASKLGNISQFIYVAFSGGWQYFAFSTMKDSDQVSTISKVQEYLGIVAFSITTFVCVFSSTIFKLLFAQEYYAGYIIVPLLFLSPLIQMLFQTGAAQYLVIKKSWYCTLILLIGAGLNVILNLTLIPAYGIEGAAIATLLGYVFSLVISNVILVKKGLIQIKTRFVFFAVLFFAFLICWRLLFSDNLLMGLSIAILFVLALVFFYRKDIRLLLNAVKKK